MVTHQKVEGLSVRFGYDEEELLYALLSSNRRVAFRYEILNADNEHEHWSSEHFLAGEVSNNTTAEIKRTARFTIRDDIAIDWGSDRIRPWMFVRMPDKHWAGWPLGVFLPESPVRSGSATGVTRDVEAYDQTICLRDDKFPGRYVAKKGQRFSDHMLWVMASTAGVPNYKIQATELEFDLRREWDPGTPKLNLLNSIASAVNYRSVFFTGWGVGLLRESVPRSQAPADHIYLDDGMSVYEPGVQQELDILSVPNKWIIFASGEKRTYITTYSNDNPHSPTSTVSRRRSIVDHRQVDPAVPNQEELDKKVKLIAERDSQVMESIPFTTRLMPNHGDRDIIRFRNENLGIESARYVEEEWTMPLEVGGKMTHRIRRAVAV